MAREAVAMDFAGLCGGGMSAERDRSLGGCTNNSRRVPGLPPDIRQQASGVQTLSAPSSSFSEGLRNWAHRFDSSTPGSIQHVIAAARLRSKESVGKASADEVRNMTEDHSVDISGVTNAEAASGLVHQSQPQQSVVEGHTARTHSSVGKLPRTAQLTVFYAGMVNVYDDVPLDKAEAIMVLAGRARSWASPNVTPVVSGSCATELGVPASISRSQQGCRADSPSRLASPLASRPECSPIVKRSKSIATREELPQARKASLARFFERRKDRLRAGPYLAPRRSNCTAPTSSSPSPSAVSSPSRSK